MMHKSTYKDAGASVTIPPVHGRQATQLRSHQRNLSLDFRSMGILLPPIEQGTNLHHRNRSLDSVLQKILEVDVIPSPEEEIIPVIESLEITPNDNSEKSNKEDVSSLGSDDSGICRSEAPESNDSVNRTDESVASDSESLTTEYEFSNSSNNCLLRLFECKLFNMPMAITYLFHSKEPGVQNYIGNKLFDFPREDVFFYLPQLINMYVQIEDVAEVVQPYLLKRCLESTDFALQCYWLLEAYSSNTAVLSKSSTLKNCILMEELKLQSVEQNKVHLELPKCKKDCKNLTVKTHQRAWSDASGLLRHQNNNDQKNSLGDLTSGRGFHNGCSCFDSCHRMLSELKGKQITCTCNAPRLLAELEFVKALTNIGKTLSKISTKDARKARLMAELNIINMNLPARVWIPLNCFKSHHVVRIPPQVSVVLDSKDKASFIIYVEVVEVDDVQKSQVTPKTMNGLRQTRSEENILSTSESDQDSCCWSQDEEDEEVEEQGKEETGAESNILISPMDIRRRLLESVNESKSSHHPEEPSAAAPKEPWESKVRRVKETSPFSHLPSWKLISVIVKTGDDLRQELLISQLLVMLQNIWQEERVPLWVYPYKILCLSNDSGFIQPIFDTISLHQIKKQSQLSLAEYFLNEFGPENTESFFNAQKNFVQSCAAYSLLCYLMQVKDRHNGNILLTGQGHLIHIDFGYILSASPRNLGFETSPFKLTPDFVAVMDGFNSDMFEYFKILMFQGLLAARKHMDGILNLVDITRAGSQLPCFKSGVATMKSLKDRFHLNMTEKQLQLFVEKLVESSVHSLCTKQ